MACVSDPEAWWSSRATPEAVAVQAAAVEACSRCPVMGLCRDYAVMASEREGVWGGLTPLDRRELTGMARR